MRSIIQEKENVEFAEIAKIATSPEDKTPHISEEVLNSLPPLLEKSVEVFTERREKDVFLTGALGVLSGCFPNVYGIYDGREVYPNLYTYVSAPAASGKGILAYSKYLGMKYHEQIKATQVEGKSQPVLFIPGNTSAAAFMGHLESNKNGIFFETEADTIGNTFKQDWGGFSDLLRKGYHHETFSSSRKMDNEFIDIESPRLSLVLSGTPEQIHGLIHSAEDGLFSRITFYTFDGGGSVWKDVSPYANGVNYKEYFKGIGEDLFEIINTLLKHPKIEFQWSKDQWDLFKETQQKFQLEAVERHGVGAVSLVRRSGLMWYRIAMILSILRKHDSISDTNKVLACEDNDFLCANELMETYKAHNLLMYGNLPKQSKSISVDKETFFLNSLPTVFERKKAVEIGSKLGMKDRTVDNRLKALVEGGYLFSPKSGLYNRAEDAYSVI